MLNILAVFIGGGVGSVLRYLSWLLVNISRFEAPAVATFVVNIFGSFVIGFCYIYFMNKIDVPLHLRLFLTVGFCGGLTTFSTFSLESLRFLQNGQYLYAFVYIFSSVIFCIGAAFAGGLVGKYFV